MAQKIKITVVAKPNFILSKEIQCHINHNAVIRIKEDFLFLSFKTGHVKRNSDIILGTIKERTNGYFNQIKLLIRIK